MSMYSKSELRALKWRSRGKVLLIVLVLSAVATPFVMMRLAANDLATEIDAAKREGLPTKPEDLVRRPAVPLAENAAPFFEAAKRKFHEISRYGPFNVSDPSNRREAHHYFALERDSIDLIFEGAKRPHCDFNIDWSQGMNIALPSFSVYQVDRVISDEADSLSFEGHPDQALNLLESIAPVARLIEETPLTLVSWESDSVRRLCYHSLGNVLVQHGREPGIAERAQRILALLTPTSDLAASIAGERWLTISSLAGKRGLDFNDLGVEGADRRRLSVEAAIPGMRDRWLAVEWKYDRDVVRIARGFNGDWMALDRQLIAAHDRAANPKSMSDDAVRFMDFGGSDLLLGITRARYEAQGKLMAQAAEAFIVWNRTGHPPDALPLPGKARQDPRRLADLNYVHSDSGFEIDAAGEDGVYMGGLTAKPDADSRHIDIVFATEDRIKAVPIDRSVPGLIGGRWLLKWRPPHRTAAVPAPAPVPSAPKKWLGPKAGWAPAGSKPPTTPSPAGRK